MFWNDPAPADLDNGDQPLTIDDNESIASRRSSATGSIWQMQGRQQAIQNEAKDQPLDCIDVPAVSILNVVTFETIGAADVSMLREDTRLMRWSCMYRATLVQPDMRVDRFPHDQHKIVIKLGILANRHHGRRWDRNIWRLALARAEDSQGSTRVPHGLVVDQVNIPDFSYDKQKVRKRS